MNINSQGMVIRYDRLKIAIYSGINKDWPT